MQEQDGTRAGQVFNSLARDIEAGRYAQGQKLPSEHSLSAMYGVSRDTVRKALQVLEATGLIQRRGTAGTFVNPAPLRNEIVHWRGFEIVQAPTPPDTPDLWADTHVRVNTSAQVAVVEFKRYQSLEPAAIVAAELKAAEALHLDPGGIVVRRRYLFGDEEGVPLGIVEAYHPAEPFGDLLHVASTVPFASWLLNRHGKRLRHASEDLNVRLPTADERRILQLSRLAPVVQIDRTVTDEDGRPVEYARIAMPAAGMRFHYEFDLPSDPALPQTSPKV